MSMQIFLSLEWNFIFENKNLPSHKLEQPLKKYIGDSSSEIKKCTYRSLTRRD